MTLDEIIKRDRKSNKQGTRGRGGARGGRGRPVGQFRSRPNAIGKRRDGGFSRGGRGARGLRGVRGVRGVRGARRFNTVMTLIIYFYIGKHNYRYSIKINWSLSIPISLA